MYSSIAEEGTSSRAHLNAKSEKKESYYRYKTYSSQCKRYIIFTRINYLLLSSPYNNTFFESINIITKAITASTPKKVPL